MRDSTTSDYGTYSVMEETLINKLKTKHEGKQNIENSYDCKMNSRVGYFL
jgi:hypothetical protein